MEGDHFREGRDLCMGFWRKGDVRVGVSIDAHVVELA
jgi:hypothetical protein